MAKIEVGKEYKNGRGQVISILAEAKNSEGLYTYLGVYKNTRYITGMECLYYNENGTSALYGNILDNLEVFDWRSLKKDDAVWLKPYTTSSEAVARHIHHVDTENDLVYYYGDGVSSLTCDLAYHKVLHCPASRVVGLVKPRA